MEEIILQLTELNAKNGSSTRRLLVRLRTLSEKSLHTHTSTFWREHCIAFKNPIKILIYILIAFFQTQLWFEMLVDCNHNETVSPQLCVSDTEEPGTRHARSCSSAPPLCTNSVLLLILTHLREVCVASLRVYVNIHLLKTTKADSCWKIHPMAAPPGLRPGKTKKKHHTWGSVEVYG